MKNLFNIETYHGCRITSPDIRTIVVDGVRGTSLRIVFQQQIEHWTVSATAYFPDQPQPNHAPLCSGIEPTPEIIEFWSQLSQLRFDEETRGLDSRVRQACQIVEEGARQQRRRKR